MQLQAMERVEAQVKELWRLSALLVEHQAVLRSSPERPCQESPWASPPRSLSQLRCEVIDQLSGTVNTVRGVAIRTGQVHDLGRPPTVKRDTFKDILADVEVPTTPQRWVWFANMATSTPIQRPVEHQMERTTQIGASWVPIYNEGLFDNWTHKRIYTKKALAIAFKQQPWNFGN